jgi:hypothetical protein
MQRLFSSVAKVNSAAEIFYYLVNIARTAGQQKLASDC